MPIALGFIIGRSSTMRENNPIIARQPEPHQNIPFISPAANFEMAERVCSKVGRAGGGADALRFRHAFLVSCRTRRFRH
jgi:hypothetical protein